VLPAGSGNGFCRSLKIPVQPEQALDVIFNPEFRLIDSGVINDSHFFGVAGFGLDAQIASDFQSLRIRGLIPYFFSGIQTFFSYRSKAYTITAENETYNVRLLVLAIANTKEYGNGARIAPQADFSDGILDICMLEPLSAIQAARHLKHLFKGNISLLRQYKAFTAQEINIEINDTKINFHTDGEPGVSNIPVHVRILPKSLKVCCPV